jgi:hypothetical protein
MKTYDAFIKQFRAHFHAYKSSFEQINSSTHYNNILAIPLLKIEELRWRSNWHMIIAKMLDARPTVFNETSNIYQKTAQKQKYGPTTNWLSDT